MNIKNSIVECVGNTPLIRVNRIIEKYNLKSDLLVKVESFNPLGSIKDRVGVNMIIEAEEKGIINKDTIIIEATSGNTGVGLAFMCASRGYRLIITMPESMSIERRRLLSALGAELVLTKATEGMKGAIMEAERIHNENPNSIIAGQFENEANPNAHKKSTALELLDQTDGKIDYLVATVGTGGTITGIGEVLKEKIPEIKVIAVEPKSSNVLSGGEARAHKIQGIGAGFVPNVLNTKIYDEVITVTDEEAYFYTNEIARIEGILCGISSGAALKAGIEVASKEEGKTVVVILPDTGERYLSCGVFDQ